jgi:hypothetical protein
MPRRWWFPAAALLLAGCFPNAVLDEGQVREATQLHFGSARFPIEVGPVVVSGNHAIADWTQGEFGGRALFERSGGNWALVLCSGDSIRSTANLKRAGVPDFSADLIAQRLAEAEAALPPERLKRMRRFVGTAQDHEKYLESLEAK